MDELVDVVDKEDKVVGQKMKSECQAKHLLHRGANVFVFKDNSYQKLLLQKRSLTKDVSPGRLNTPGGHVAVGESYAHAAKREFLEEMYRSKGKNVVLKELFKIKKFTSDCHELVTVFRTVDPGPFEIDPVEVDSYYFKDINVILKDININPEKYARSTLIFLKEYAKRFL